MKAAAPALRSNLSIVSEEQNWTTSVTGTTPEYFDIRNWPMDVGRRLHRADVDGGTKVIVLGQTVVDKLFGANANPVGQTVRVGSTPVHGRRRRVAEGAVGDRAGLRRRRVHPRHDVRAEGPGRPRQVPPGHDQRRGDVGRGHDPRAQKDITALLRDRHHLAPARRRRLLDPQPERDRRRAAAGHRDDDDAARERRRGVAARRRHRHHEHHARERDRADARDRHPHGASAPSRSTS